MKVGDLVRCKVTKHPDTAGVVVAVVSEPRAVGGAYVEVLTNGTVHHWSPIRLEVINESR